ncbi:diaminopimelate decarboxylase [Acidiferrimicrobium sp. IK]|uniref:diaminopimelate decarboxylase n=1 Tax=Acidiferrimicrobium sp. IK TaxID=2871700 RepID=UPI0021CB3818|nr:diaminopimelate decarboxylase [Acidiferrimicrobium sp. IK]MCU4186474.1 diaminopimelate decarboxylase [Acidiferrimicrobium sp. IK]
MSRPVDLDLLPEHAEVGKGGRLTIAGVDVLDLCEEHGTPVFVYDEQHIRNRCREAVAAFGADVAYASKAFFCTEMARVAHEEGMRIDVSTGGELFVALHAGVAPERLVLHGNNKSDAELAMALDAGVGRIVVDSFDELDRLERLCEARNARPAVLVRITPGVEAHTHEYVMTGQDDSKFGFGLASGDAEKAVGRLLGAPSGPELVGVHAHIGSQIFALDSFAKAVEAIAPFFSTLGVSELCIGGGLGVGYVEGEPTPSFEGWARAVRAAAADAGIPAGVSLSAEPGRAIVAAAAITCYTVGTIKDIPGIRTYVSVDGGMSDNPRPVLYGSGYEAFLPRETAASRPRTVTVVGKHCESGDVIVRDAAVPEDLAVGDILVTPVTGAYGHSMASNYNKVPRPPVVWVRDGAARVVVRRETFEDLVSRDC